MVNTKLAGRPSGKGGKTPLPSSLGKKKTFESLLFETISKENLVTSIQDIMEGRGDNVQQINLVMKMVDLMIQREKREGTVDFDTLTVLQVAREGMRDDLFMNTLIKAMDAKKEFKDGLANEAFQEYTGVVHNYQRFRKGTKTSVQEETEEVLSGAVDTELEEASAKG